MSPATGPRIISHYRIEAEIGKGGMGVVYRAVDLDLGRTAAIKVLAPGHAVDPHSKKRFVEEARAASALNHPNIATIYESGCAADVDFIAMEYVSGITLREALKREVLPLDTVIEYAVQISDALAAAHAVGIVHRDLKPANIILTPGGAVKIIDFGVAKAPVPIAVGPDDRTVTMLTNPGTVVGTYPYMSPEQVAGRVVDGRSDIFSFGAVLYEMICGRRAFRGEAPAEIIAEVLHDTPAMPEQVAAYPELGRILKRCLKKDPAQRFQHAADLKVALQEVREEGAAEGPRAVVLATSALAHWTWFAAGAAVSVLVCLALWMAWSRIHAPPPERILTRLTSDDGVTSDPAISPDGKTLAYASDRGGGGRREIWIQQVSGGEPVRLTHEGADATYPSFSPDGASIAFRSDTDGGGIYIMSALGTDRRLLVKDGCNPRFSPDGHLVTYWVGNEERTSPHGRIYTTTVDGASTAQLASDFADARFPIWSPDGKHILFEGIRNVLRARDEEHDWWVAGLDRSPPVRTHVFEMLKKLDMSVYLGPGDWIDHRVIFSASAGHATNLWQIALSPGAWRPVKRPEKLTFGTAREGLPSVARDGTIVFATLMHRKNVWTMPLNIAATQGERDLQRLTDTTGDDNNPGISADGRILVYLSRRQADTQVRVKDLRSGNERPITFGTGEQVSPTLTADGSKVAYSVVEGARRPIYVVPVSNGPAERICDDCGDPLDWTAANDGVIFAAGRQKTIGLLKIGDGTRTELLQDAKENIDEAHLSPDNEWIAFIATAGTDESRAYVARYRAAHVIPQTEWIPVTGGGFWVDKIHWSRDGKYLYFYSKEDGFGCIWRQQWEGAEGRLVGPRTPVRHFHSVRFSMLHMYLPTLSLSVAEDQLAFNLIELNINIWMTRPPQSGPR